MCTMPTSASPVARPNGSDGSIGSYERRARKIVSQAGLFDLVQDMASSVDRMEAKLDRLIKHLGVPEE